MKRSMILIGLFLLAGCKAKPDMTIQQFMKTKVDPTSKVLFNAVQYVSDEKGNHDIKPETDADWERVAQAARDLQAQAKELQSSAYTEGRNPDWTKMSQDLVTVSQRAEQAAKEKNPDKVFEVSGDVYNVCSGCHTVYPATVGPEASGSPKA